MSTKETLMPYKTEIAKALSEHWQFIAFVVSCIMAWWGGKKQQEYKVAGLADDLKTVRNEMKEFRAELTKRDNADHENDLVSAKAIAKLCADTQNNSDALKRIEARLEQKADK